MAESEDVNTLKRRGRRRLVGAIALVLAAVIVLPMVFDSEPRSSTPPVSVRIPNEDDSAFAPKVTAKSPERTPEKAAEKAAEKAPEKMPEPAAGKASPEPDSQKAPEPVADKAAAKAQEKPVEKAPSIEIKVNRPAEPAAAPASERVRAETALAGGEQFVVPAGAYADPAGVIEKLKTAKIPYYTEPIATKQGTVIRVRAGPFASREAADRALQQLKDLGLKPGNVAARS